MSRCRIILKLGWAAGLVILGAALAIGLRARAQKPLRVDEIMRVKLEQSQRLLEGVATEDYGLIRTNAQKMIQMSQAAGWQAFPTEEYLHHTANFRRAAEALIRAAKDRNVDGAALAYVQMTMSCVDCHKYVRQERRAGLDREEPGKEGLLAFIER